MERNGRKGGSSDALWSQWVTVMTVPLGNKESDELAKEGAGKEIPEPIDIQILTDFDVQGVKLATINQATAYKGILKK